MKKRLIIFVTCCLLLLANALLAQNPEENKLRRAAQGKGAYTQEELVSFKSDVPYKTAMESLSTLSKKFLKKPIVDPSPLTTPINVEIQSMYWKDAMEVILRTNNLWYQELEDYIQVATVGALAVSGAAAPSGGAVAPIDSSAIISKTREVTISAIFLEINKSKLRESGLNFNIFRGRDLNLGVEFTGADKVSTSVFGVTVSPTNPKLAVNIDAALKVFESEQVGEVLSRPQTNVRSGGKGRLQVGTDFSIKEKDFSGNIIDKFYSTGTILDVSVKVYRYGSTDFIDLAYHIERSTVTPGTVTTLVNKSTSDGRSTVLNGEEMYVAGLYSNEDNATREGIPLLKDLPWWVFGLRYIFGYDKSETTRKELIILMKAELVPTIEERVKELAKERNILQDKLKEIQQDVDKKSKKQ
jgi:type IV pilus assembly protein PilQ